jgi:drug/metabolite transporter (DMT)-like permease
LKPFALELRPATGLLLAALGAMLFATKGIIIKLALAQDIDVVTTLAWRMIVAVPVFVTVGIFEYRRRQRAYQPGSPLVLGWKSFAQAFGIGLIGYYLASYLDFAALNYISASFDRLILLTYPFFVVLFGALFFKRRITPPMVMALLASYLGIAVIFWHDFNVSGDNVLLGAALVFGSSLAYAGYQILAKPLIDRIGSGLFTSIALSAAGPAVVIHFLLTHPVSDLAISGNGLLLMVAIGLVATVIPAYCIAAAIGLVGPERTAVIGNVSPIITITLAITVLGEAFTPFHAIGSALVLLGVVLFNRKAKAKALPPAVVEE